jgi:predicted nucleic acid-binding protein
MFKLRFFIEYPFVQILAKYYRNSQIHFRVVRFLAKSLSQEKYHLASSLCDLVNVSSIPFIQCALLFSEIYSFSQLRCSSKDRKHQFYAELESSFGIIARLHWLQVTT